MTEAEERIVVLAPSARDGPVTAGILGGAGFACVLACNVGELCRVVEGGAAAALIAEEALSTAAITQRLVELLRRQEPWSDLPVILFTGRRDGRDGAAVRRPTVETLAPFGNVTLLDRPVPVVTLVSAVRAALRARRRQYAARAVLVELQAVLDAVPAAVWIARDTRGDRIDANRFGAEMLRRRPGDNVSVTAPDGPRHFTVQRAGRTLEEDELPIQRAARRGEEIHDADLDLVFDDGEVRHLAGNAAPLRDADGAVKGSVGAFIDISARKAAEERLKEADRRKTEFIALLSHELRNPLAPIRHSLALLERSPAGSAAALRARDVLERQTRQLSRLVDDLLDLSRITYGKIEVKLARIDAREVVRRAAADARTVYEEREVELVLAEPPEPLWVDGDAARLAQMLGNLLNNALKFTPPRGRVTLRASRRGGTGELSVRDTGPGLDPADLERIFDPFVQAHGGRAGQGGLGLGLALVRELAVKHGGSVRAASEGQGKGAEFVIQLPLAAAPAAAPPRPGSSEAAGLRVLIVDDNADSAETLADLLALTGNRVSTASTGSGGVAAAASERPDVLICDIGLPDMSGHDVIRSIRAGDGGRRIFAMALTGYAQPRDREAAIAAGFDAHLAKPPALEELQGLLARAAQLRASRASGA